MEEWANWKFANNSHSCILGFDGPDPGSLYTHSLIQRSQQKPAQIWRHDNAANNSHYTIANVLLISCGTVENKLRAGLGAVARPTVRPSLSPEIKRMNPG